MTITGRPQSLWRAVEQAGSVVASLVPPHREKGAATRFVRKVLTGLPSIPQALIPDQLGSDGAATRERVPGVAHRRHRSLNTRAEHAPHPTRQRARRRRFANGISHL